MRFKVHRQEDVSEVLYASLNINTGGELIVWLSTSAHDIGSPVCVIGQDGLRRVSHQRKELGLLMDHNRRIALDE